LRRDRFREARGKNESLTAKTRKVPFSSRKRLEKKPGLGRDSRGGRQNSSTEGKDFAQKLQREKETPSERGRRGKGCAKVSIRRNWRREIPPKLHSDSKEVGASLKKQHVLQASLRRWKAGDSFGVKALPV